MSKLTTTNPDDDAQERPSRRKRVLAYGAVGVFVAAGIGLSVIGALAGDLTGAAAQVVATVMLALAVAEVFAHGSPRRARRWGLGALTSPRDERERSIRLVGLGTGFAAMSYAALMAMQAGIFLQQDWWWHFTALWVLGNGTRWAAAWRHGREQERPGDGVQAHASSPSP